MTYCTKVLAEPQTVWFALLNLLTTDSNSKLSVYFMAGGHHRQMKTKTPLYDNVFFAPRFGVISDLTEQLWRTKYSTIILEYYYRGFDVGTMQQLQTAEQQRVHLRDDDFLLR